MYIVVGSGITIKNLISIDQKKTINLNATVNIVIDNIYIKTTTFINDLVIQLVSTDIAIPIAHVHMSNVTVQGSDNASDGVTAIAIQNGTGTKNHDIHLENISVYDWHHDAVNILNTSKVTVNNMTIDNCEGIFFTGGNNIMLNNITCDATHGTSIIFGDNSDKISKGITISNCVCTNYGSAAPAIPQRNAVGIMFDGGAVNKIENVVISNCVCTNTSGTDGKYGLSLYQDCNNVTITDCDFSGNDTAAIFQGTVGDGVTNIKRRYNRGDQINYLVADSDSSEDFKGRADYIWHGIADDVHINLAL